VVAFVLWTLVVWATRIDNIAFDDGLDTAGKATRMALAFSFVAFAVVTLAWAGRERRGGLRPCTIYLVGPFAAWTVLVWVVRGTGILIDDHEVAFKVVHAVLATVSIALALAAVLALHRSQASAAAPLRAPTPAARG